MSESPELSCTPPAPGQNKSQEIPAISRTVPAPTLSEPTFAGILSLISKKLKQILYCAVFPYQSDINCGSWLSIWHAIKPAHLRSEINVWETLLHTSFTGTHLCQKVKWSNGNKFVIKY